MNKRIILLAALALGCETSTGMMMMTGGTDEISGEITVATKWVATKKYHLNGQVWVRGVTLTIEPGTVVTGGVGSALLIASDAKIDAQGTKTAPIVFTSDQPAGMRKKGDWGGVALFGKAKINAGDGVDGMKSQIFEAFGATEERARYGGGDDAHDCGKIRYARIEFAGFEFQPMKELNGLTLSGCGSQTVIDFVQVHRGSDDGVEMFGGTANLKHIVITQANDDGLDWDFGWTGKAQHIVIQQSASEGNCGIEADNNEKAPGATPVSNPTIYNMTMVGSGAGAMTTDKQIGMLLRRGTAGQMFNVIMVDFAAFPVDITGPETVDQASSGNLFIKNSIFFGNGSEAMWDDPMDTKEAGTITKNGAMVTVNAINEGDFFRTSTMNNLVGMDPRMTSANSLTAPTFKPAAGSPALEPARAATPPSNGFFDAAATYIGAVGSDDWTAGWTAFPEN